MDGMMYVDLEIFDMVGQKLASFANCNGGRKFIDIADWHTGVYLVSFTTDGNSYSRKVIIETKR